MRNLHWKQKVAIIGVILLFPALYTLYLTWFQWPRSIDSPFMIKVHMISEGARPKGADNPYSYEIKEKDGSMPVRESKKCRRCHGNMLQEEDGEPLYPIHYAMLKPITAKNAKKKNESILALECVNCHKKVDLGKRTPERATFRVDRTMCVKCHELQQTEKLDADVSGGKADIEDIGARNLIANHGVDQESGWDWNVDHREIAGVIGAVACRECHAFGSELDFCNECHDGWHPEDWKGSHPAAVRELGIERCTQCHVPDSAMDICSRRCHGTNPLLAGSKQKINDEH